MAPIKAALAATFCVFALASCADESTNSTPTPNKPAQRVVVGAQSVDVVPPYSQERHGTFVDMPHSALWRHTDYCQGVVVIALRRTGVNRGVYRGRILINRTEWQQARHAITSHTGEELDWAETLLPTLQVQFKDFRAFLKIQRVPVCD